MPAIFTKFHPASGYRGARIVARASGMGADHICGPSPGVLAHRAAALKLASSQQWAGLWQGFPSDVGFVFIRLADCAGDASFTVEGPHV